MKVVAKHEVAFKGKAYKFGDVVEMSQEEFDKMQGDFYPNSWRQASTKEKKSIKEKAKKVVEKSESK